MIHLLVAISSISSSEAAYDGNGLKLSGQVVIEHPMGKMEAQEALLQKPDDRSETFNAIHLMKAVRIALQNRGSVSCETADFDLTTFKGSLQAKEGEKVSYCHTLENNLPLRMQSLQALLQFQPGKDASLLQAISAVGAVEIAYGEGYCLKADSAEFQKSLLIASSSSGTLCKLTHLEDSVEAERIELHPEEEKVTVAHPKGSFHSLALGENSALSFECDQLIWDQQHQTLQFNSAIKISEPTLGQVYAKSGSAKYEEGGLSSFDLKGEVLLSKSEERCGFAHELTYSQETRTVVLKAAQGGRVLFWDKLKNIAMSATEVQISRDPQTHEEIVKGVGTVSFRLSSAEYEMLKKLFPQVSIPEGHAHPAR